MLIDIVKKGAIYVKKVLILIILTLGFVGYLFSSDLLKEVTVVPIVNELDEGNEITQDTKSAPELEMDEINSESEQKELDLKRIQEAVEANFPYYVSIPLLSYNNDFVLLNDREMVYVEEKASNTRQNNDYFIYLYNFEKEEKQLLLKLEAKQGVPRDITYNQATESVYFKTTQEELIKIDLTTRKSYTYKGKFSPDSKWMVYRDWEKGGIWGTELATGNTVQWTDGEWDQQPLWLPNSEGFIYLKQTDTQLGDGAGPAMKLAQFMISTGDDFPFSFDEGYWGGIEWLNPGQSIVAYNGFDDVISVAIVNLTNNKKIQLIENEMIGMAETSINKSKNELLLSLKGKISFYNDKGDLITTKDWIEEKEDFVPTVFSFSPDGSQLAYLTGVPGWGIDDIVPGRKVIVSKSDGSDERFLTFDYLYIASLKWSPDSDALAVKIEDGNANYIGLLRLDEKE